MDKLEVGFFIDSYDAIDGVIVVMHQYIKNLSDRVNFYIACPKSKNEGQKGKTNAEIIYCKGVRVPILKYDMGLPGIDKKFFKTLVNRKTDIIHVHSPFGVGHVGVKVGKVKNIPVVTTLHSQYKQDIRRAVGPILTKIAMSYVMKTYNSADEVWCVNENTRRLLLDEYKCKAKNTAVMGNATAHLPLEKDHREEVNTKLGITENDRVLLFLGRLVPLKGVALLPKVLKALKNRNEKFKLVFAGNGHYYKHLTKETEKLGLDNDVIFVTDLNEDKYIEKLYQRADLFVFPSFYDTDGIVKFEAAAQGTPTLFGKGALATGGITDGFNGYIAEATPEKYADKIIEIFNNKQQYDKVSKNVTTELYRNWKEVTDKAYNRYLELIEMKKKGLI